MKFSLILATVERTREVARFLASLEGQTYPHFEVVVVDQNDDDRVDRLIASHEMHYAIRRLRASRGLSRARNQGIAVATGDVLAFPDDDCWYPPELLVRVVGHLESGTWQGVAGRAVDSVHRPSGGMRWDQTSGLLAPGNVWRRATSYTIFLQRVVVERVGGFDESLGIGSGTRWGSGEETDYLLRAMAAGFRIFYDPALYVYHEQPVRNSAALGFSYGMGMGRVLRKHHYPPWFVFQQVSRAVIGAVAAAAAGRRDDARFRWAVARGRVLGWLR
ncbi:MAG: glycosyltransferase [Armatimonadota bacterium]|nr:glycosyltransferase [Armatimonadota bacterium]MDR7450407.1 glycosyltransferase [Armatimonadota bacterium]MDR7467010.1 glycosyltransferase [Armatimonadota bacterium]MDR7493448.1 glycosyltransferase [Armatimonadota bacterium]MDR7498713.1 glycosyltransferase [Armatimonadota bacterium]